MTPHPEFSGIFLFNDAEYKRALVESAIKEKAEMPRTGIDACWDLQQTFDLEEAALIKLADPENKATISVCQPVL